jgi:hypothetical protein
MKHLPFVRSTAILAVVVILFAAVSQASPRAGSGAGPDQGSKAKHIASPEAARAAVTAVPAARAALIDKIDRVLESEAAREQLARWAIGADRAKAVVAGLGDEELAYLALRADGVMANLQGGRSNTTFYLILLGAFLLPILIALALS